MKNAYLKQKGSLIFVTTVCKAGHTEPWFSQPFTKGMAAGNLICSSGILFTGNHFMRLNTLMSVCNIRFFEKGTFYYIQRKYLWAVVNNHHIVQQREILRPFRGKPLVLTSDGQCDSPGYNAKYGTYSVMEVTSEKIMHFSLVQVSEVANSSAMEEGLKRCLEFLDGQVIDLLATDTYLTLTNGRCLNIAKNDPKRRSTNQKSMLLNSLQIAVCVTLSRFNSLKLMKPSIYCTFSG